MSINNILPMNTNRNEGLHQNAGNPYNSLLDNEQQTNDYLNNIMNRYRM